MLSVPEIVVLFLRGKRIPRIAGTSTWTIRQLVQESVDTLLVILAAESVAAVVVPLPVIRTCRHAGLSRVEAAGSVRISVRVVRTARSEAAAVTGVAVAFERLRPKRSSEKTAERLRPNHVAFARDLVALRPAVRVVRTARSAAAAAAGASYWRASIRPHPLRSKSLRYRFVVNQHARCKVVVLSVNRDVVDRLT